MYKKKIIHIIGATIAGGAEKFVCELAIELQNYKYDVYVLVLSSKKDQAGESLRKKMSENNVAVLDPGAEKVGLKTVVWLIKNINHIKPDLIHLHTPNTELAYFLSGFFVRHTAKLFRTIHNTTLPDSKLMNLAFKRNKVEASIGCGAAVFELNKINGDNVCIPNGVDFDWPIKDESSTESARKKLGLGSDEKIYISVGSMSGSSLETAQKAHDMLIRAWGKAVKDADNAKLILIGDGSLREELEKIACNSKSIEFLGVRSDVKDWLIAADVFVMPSRYEGLPIAGIEAVGTGLKMIFSNIAPLKEIAPDDCLWGEVDDEASLTRNIQSLLKQDLAVKKSAVMSFRERFSMKSVAENYHNEYKKQRFTS